MTTARHQSFQDRPDPSTGAARLAALRTELRLRGLDGFFVPRADAHQGEYVPACDERLAWLTGFTGSAGACAVLPETALVFVDGRYTVQVREQIDLHAFTPASTVGESIEARLGRELRAGLRFGYDPALLTADQARRLREAALRAGAEAIAVPGNPIDAVWTDRPAAPQASIVLHDMVHAGEGALAKIERVRAAVTAAGCDALVISDPHALCWLFNMRGGDVGHTPLALGYGIVPREGRAQMFVTPQKLSNAVRAALSDLAEIAAPERFDAALAALGAAGARVRLDTATAGEALHGAISDAGGTVDPGPDPIALMKAVKNDVEIAGARAAHLRDGAAVAEFLAWLAQEVPKGDLTEIDAAVKLEACRAATGQLRDIAFPTIAGAGPNAALPHYRVSTTSNRAITPGVFLIDSGGQYLDGTTDITRTVAIGTPTAEMRDRFTRVLRGHLAIARAVFPEGTSGAQLDAFARVPLWQAGLDFDHGTGHGVGSYLSVHEGPQRLSKLGTTPLKAGMILSNEPGYYKEGAFGIRIETLVLVERRAIAGAEREMLGFETLTLSPYDQALIDIDQLTADEIAWIDAYHARVRTMLAGLLTPEARIWLIQATAPLDTAATRS